MHIHVHLRARQAGKTLDALNKRQEEALAKAQADIDRIASEIERKSDQGASVPASEHAALRKAIELRDRLLAKKNT